MDVDLKSAVGVADRVVGIQGLHGFRCTVVGNERECGAGGFGVSRRHRQAVAAGVLDADKAIAIVGVVTAHAGAGTLRPNQR